MEKTGSAIKYHTWCPTKYDRWWKVLNVFFHNLLNCLIPKRMITNIMWQSYHSKMDCKVNYIWVNDLFNKINSIKYLISKTIYDRRHSKPFINCHVSWDTLYKNLRNFFTWIANNICCPITILDRVIPQESSCTWFTSSYAIEAFIELLAIGWVSKVTGNTWGANKHTSWSLCCRRLGCGWSSWWSWCRSWRAVTDIFNKN